MTDMTATRAPREHRPDGCLHCCLMAALEGWFQQHGRRQQGQVVVDVIEAVSKLTECAVEIINMTPDRSQRRRGLRFAHEAIDAADKSQRTGKLVEVDIPAEQ